MASQIRALYDNIIKTGESDTSISGFPVLLLLFHHNKVLKRKRDIS